LPGHKIAAPTVHFIFSQFLIAKKQYAILDKIIFSLVTEAEKKYDGGGTGAAKLAAVIEWLYPKIPAVIRLFITSAQLEKLIDHVLIEARERWNKNPNLAAYINGADMK
jgi:hypothetical protein